MRSAVVFPQPDGPDEHHELAVADLEIHARDGPRSVGVDLADSLEGHGCHRVSPAGVYPERRAEPSPYVTRAAARQSSTAISGSDSSFALPARAERDRHLRDRHVVGRLDDVHEVVLAERRPLVEHLRAHLLDVAVHLTQAAPGSRAASGRPSRSASSASGRSASRSSRRSPRERNRASWSTYRSAPPRKSSGARTASDEEDRGAHGVVGLRLEQEREPDAA